MPSLSHDWVQTRAMLLAKRSLEKYPFAHVLISLTSEAIGGSSLLKVDPYPGVKHFIIRI